jgi:carboxyl-terminal processing protease
MEEKPKGKLGAIGRSAGNIVILLVIFLVGVNVGNGRINLHKAHTQNGNLPAKLDYNSVNDVYQSLKDNYDGKLSEAQLEDGLKHGLAESTKDPYTVYFTAKEAQDFNSELNNSFSGIGAQLGQDKEGNLEVVAPIEDLPAAKAGLQAKDIIVTINGQPTTDMSVDEAVSKIRGKSGTEVKLQVVRNRSQTLDLKITRQDINLPSVKSKVLDGNIGYIQVTTFSNDTSDLARKAAQDLKDKQVKGIVLDLRNNPGGLLDAAVHLSSLWLDRGQLILQEKRGSEVIDSENASGGNILHGIPTVVLINSGSASASEITAGALHDQKAAHLIGEKSYGKGVVQQLINLRDGSQLKVTIASWYRPNGQNINKQGIKPDQAVNLTDTDRQAAADPQLDAAQAYLNK